MKYDKFFEFIELSLNNSCHLQCVGCQSLKPNSSKARELSVLEILPLLKKFHPKELFICGNDGEPLEHSNIKEILPALNKSFHDSKILVATNGELLEEVLLEISDAVKGITFQIAVDGPDQRTHELTRVGGSLSKVLKNIEFAQKNELNIEVIYSRHKLNEEYAERTRDLIYEKFGLELLFRDTTITAKHIEPPRQLSSVGDVSILYGPRITIKQKPWFKRIYINSNGRAYPCVSFIYRKSEVEAPSIYEYESELSFISDFIKFSKRFCCEFQDHGDLRQCSLNCGTYVENFDYDTMNSLRIKND